MLTNLNNKIIWFLLVFFIAPFGVGLAFIPGFQSIDLPKIIPFVFFIIIILKFDFKKIDLSVLFFLILVLLHLISVFYSFQINNSLVEFFSHLLIFYPGFLIPFLIIKSEKSLKKLMTIINIVVLLYILFSITEFIFQVNFFDSFRNTYLEGSRFNNQLGFARLGYKAAMGPYASTLPFAYAFVTLFFLKDLFKPEKLNKKFIKSLITVLGVIAICFTLSRAAIFILFFLMILKNLFKTKFRTKLFFIFSFVTISIFVWNLIQESPFEKYIDAYIFGISESSAGTDLRLNNNLIDLNFALESPILGHGAGMLRFNKIEGVGLASSDSSYLLTIFADRGIISLLLFLLLISLTLKRYYFISKLKSIGFNYRSLLFSFIAIFLCINSSQRSEIFFLFFFVIGMINKIYIINKNSC
jgi:hypothetical protein